MYQQQCGDTRRGWDVTDVFLGSLAALHAAAAGPAPLLRDRRLKLVPAVGGFRLPSHYHWLLLPFSKRKVCHIGSSEHCTGRGSLLPLA